MQRKIKLPLSVGDTVTLFCLNGRGPFHIKLLEFSISENRLKWHMRTADRHTLFGSGVRDVVMLPYFKDTWICVSIPVLMHVNTKGLLADFIFNVPASVRVEKNDPLAKVVSFELKL